MTSILMCRYGPNGKLQKREVDMSTPYIAVSHVWGPATWQNVPALGIGEIIVSPHKAKFLTDKLQALVGDSDFWMDILCVDQLDAKARLSIVKSIPAIYRSAQATIVIRDGDGLHSCCADAVGSFETWSGDGLQKLADHVVYNTTSHGSGFSESWLGRLWPLQEVLLSDRLQFASCDRWEPPKRDARDPYRDVGDLHKLSSDLLCTASAWAEYCVDRKVEWDELTNRMDFIKAILHNGTVSRPKRMHELKEIGATHNTMFGLHRNSTRVTSKSRDFLLAMLPPFSWYQIPETAGSMSFGDLFVDCHTQAKRAGYPFFPRITKGMTEATHNLEDSVLPTADIPTPRYLGDFIKLFGSSEAPGSRWMGKVGLMVNTFIAAQTSSLPSMDMALDFIEKSMEFNRDAWAGSFGGELSEHGSWPDVSRFLNGKLVFDKSMEDIARARCEPDYYESQVPKILDAMWLGTYVEAANKDTKNDWNYYRKWLVQNDPPYYRDTLLYFGALY